MEDEDFEGAASTVANEWDAGASTDIIPAVSEVLGLLGTGSEQMSKTIDIPRSSGPDQMEADRVTIEFVIYQIDTWDSASDKFYLEINGTPIDLGEMDLSLIHI